MNCAMRSWPLPKTTALGGVATGIMKAQLAASTVGNTSSRGLSPIATAIEAAIGRKVAVVAVLLTREDRWRLTLADGRVLDATPAAAPLVTPHIIALSLRCDDGVVRHLALLDDTYKLTRIQPVDMFPQTHHVENVVLLERR